MSSTIGTMQFSRRRIPLLLAALDRLFPPNPGAFMSGDEQTRHEIVKADATMGSYLAELGAARIGELDILDYGCGWGGETLWLAQKARSVCGVDVDGKAIAQAQKACDVSGVTNCRFEWSSDGRLPFADASFDAVLSTDTFEHVMDLDLAFSEIARVLKPGGSLLTRFGPLFHSPHGYHLYWACQVPYAHLIFGLDAIAAMRANRGGSAKQPASWQELGLNGLRFRDYAASVERAGFEVVRFHPIPVKGLKRLAAAPLIGDLFIFGVDCHIRRPQGRKAGRL
jgi:SAM-dependent methyltransferase